MGGGGRRSRGPRPEPRDYAGEAENARKAAEARAEEDMSRLREQQAAHQKRWLRCWKQLTNLNHIPQQQ